MVFKNHCILVLWMKVVSALEGLKNLIDFFQPYMVPLFPYCYSCNLSILWSPLKNKKPEILHLAILGTRQFQNPALIRTMLASILQCLGIPMVSPKYGAFKPFESEVHSQL